MAVVYNYLFPTLFLMAFYALYRYERVPLQAHMGELLTVTVLGAACFGLPTTIVSERERGVWRRYRLVPAPTSAILASTLAARYVMTLLAVVLQLVLAVAIGMPLPSDPLGLLVTFTCSAIAFIGVGLVIAMLADNVPAVQALGQSVFLPMLIIGGVAVPLSRLPEWAQIVSSFLPGRYSVQAIQTVFNGAGLGNATFSLAVLVIIGAAGGFAASRLFRWDAQERSALHGRKAWVAAAVVPWIAIGIIAESRGNERVAVDTATVRVAEVTRSGVRSAASPPPAATPERIEPLAPERSDATAPAERPQPVRPVQPDDVDTRPVPPSLARWAGVTIPQIENDLVFDRLPPDDAVVTPLARLSDPVDPTIADHLALIRGELDTWAPGLVADTEQRTRNLLYVAGVIDLLQLQPLESFVPRLIYERLQRDVPRDDLIKILYWIAVNWDGGEHDAIYELAVFDLPDPPDDVVQIRNRAAIYAVKLLGRLIGQLPE